VKGFCAITLFRVINRYVGNLPPMPGLFPDYPAPVVRNASDDRELTMMRWGMPPPPKFGGAPVTNIRNTISPHWRGSLKPESRCLVPANSFAEYAPATECDCRADPSQGHAGDLDDRRKSAMSGCVRLGTRRRRCSGFCRMMR
jgi:putative SOS response-associated peptidase YedK